MSTEENKAIVRRAYDEIWNKGNLEALAAYLAPDFTDHDLPSAPGSGVDDPRQAVIGYRTAVPDLQLVVEDQIAEGDKVLTRWVATGTHQGSLFGIPPSGHKLTVTGMFLDRLENGKIAESWANWDTLGLLQQIGVAPAGTAQR